MSTGRGSSSDTEFPSTRENLILNARFTLFAFGVGVCQAIILFLKLQHFHRFRCTIGGEEFRRSFMLSVNCCHLPLTGSADSFWFPATTLLFWQCCTGVSRSGMYGKKKMPGAALVELEGFAHVGSRFKRGTDDVKHQPVDGFLAVVRRIDDLLIFHFPAEHVGPILFITALDTKPDVTPGLGAVWQNSRSSPPRGS